MQPGLLIRLRPSGAWRYGPADGGHDRVDTLYRSDRLYSAITLASARLGFLDEWLAATAHAAKPAVALSSLFPFQADTLYAIPPATLWPPPPALLHSPSPVFLTKIRWKTARFVPLSVIDALITGQPLLADQWWPDPESTCLLRRDRPSASPFRVVVRATAAVDRLTRTSDESKPVACVEFEPGAGLWATARFADSSAEETWSPRLQAALRLLSDSGFGGGRGRGWGQVQSTEFQAGPWPTLLFPKLGRLLRNTAASVPESEPSGSSLFWLLSLFSPASADKIDWAGGSYSLSARAGRVESNSGSGLAKKTVRMVNEGCVLASEAEPIGTAVDVAPDGFAHPVYRSGLALALRLPVVDIQPQEAVAVEEPSSAEALVEAESEPQAPQPEPVVEEEPKSEFPPAEPVLAEEEHIAEPEETSLDPAPVPTPVEEVQEHKPEPSAAESHTAEEVAPPATEPQPAAEDQKKEPPTYEI